jgi:hypothetical protein
VKNNVFFVPILPFFRCYDHAFSVPIPFGALTALAGVPFKARLAQAISA